MLPVNIHVISLESDADPDPRIGFPTQSPSSDILFSDVLLLLLFSGFVLLSSSLPQDVNDVTADKIAIAINSTLNNEFVFISILWLNIYYSYPVPSQWLQMPVPWQ